MAILFAFCACSPSRSTDPSSITVAAAANLQNVFPALAERFERASGISVQFSFGSTANLAHQIENGAPFDVFAAADREHVDALANKGMLVAGSAAVYAQGILVVWTPESSPLRLNALDDLRQPEFRFLAVSKPDLAPYGRAAVESLRNAGLWEELQPRITYAQNVLMTKQFAESGNADAAMTALSLVKGRPGRWIEIPSDLHEPIEQALGVVKASEKKAQAIQFTEFVLGEEGQAMLESAGYKPPKAETEPYP